MIRAVVQDGMIQPLDPLPPDWEDGREVMVNEIPGQPDRTAETVEQWAAEMNRLCAELDDPEMWNQIDANLAEADRLDKEIVRRAACISSHCASRG